jgi:superfamily II DNA or RNA helicase
MASKKQYKTFEEARAFTRNLNLKGQKEWREWTKSEMRKSDIPTNPHLVYKDKGWIGYGDFLGTGNVASKNIEFLSFEEARDFARNLNLKSSTEWFNWTKSGERPDNIPANPYKVYKDKGWISYGDWLGTWNVSTQNMKFLYFEEVREFARSLNLKSSTEWFEWAKSGERPDTIPANPAVVYKDKGWISWGDFLGNEFLSFEEAREFVRNLNLNNNKEWNKWSKSGKRPENIPGNPNKIYKGKGWMNWGDFLGTGRVRDKDFLSFEEARAFARNLNLKSQKEWEVWSKSGYKPENIPVHPGVVYKDKGWAGWADFLGYLGNGNHRWSQLALVKFLEDFRGLLHTCSPATLYMIIESKRLSPYITKDDIKKIQETKPNSSDRKEIVSDIINEITQSNIDELELNSELEEVLESTELNDALEAIERGGVDSDGLTKEEATDIQVKYLKGLDDVPMSNSLNLEEITSIISESINNLWYDALNNVLDLETIKSTSLKSEIPQTIADTFLKEYEEVINLELPEGWTYPHQPLLMQKLVAYRLMQRKRYGNWSSVGAGKTIGAILAGRYVGAKNTLIITFNSTIGKESERGWTKEIRDSFKDSKIYTKPEKDIKFDDESYNYLVLNYETFQQKDSAEYVKELLKRNRFDYVVLDEVQSIKQRDEQQSKRREMIESILEGIKELNPDYYLHVISATPVINNLIEAKTLIELVEGKKLDDVQTDANIANCLKLNRMLTNCGIRFKDIGNNFLKNNEYTILDIEADHLYEEASSIKSNDFLGQEQLMLNARLDAILPYVNTAMGKTVIYTAYVSGIEERIYDYLTQRGFKVGVYTGSKSKLDRESALTDFIDGDLDVLVGSRPIGTGVDGLQKISDTLIPLSLPWTDAELVQLVGRLSRKGCAFKETGVNVIIPLVSINGSKKSYRWDYKKYNTITYKKTIANAVVDGIIPDKNLPPKQRLIDEAESALPQLIEKIKKEEIPFFDKDELKVKLTPSPKDNLEEEESKPSDKKNKKIQRSKK